MKEKKILVILLLIICSSFKVESSFSKITKDGITVEYPSSWEVLDVPTYSILVKEKASSEQYELLTTFGVEIDKNFKSLKSYSSYWKNKMNKNESISSWRLISEKNIIFKGYKAKEFICDYNVGKFKAKTKVVILVNNKSIININSTSSQKHFSKKNEIVDLIYDSIVIDN